MAKILKLFCIIPILLIASFTFTKGVNADENILNLNCMKNPQFGCSFTSSTSGTNLLTSYDDVYEKNASVYFNYNEHNNGLWFYFPENDYYLVIPMWSTNVSSYDINLNTSDYRFNEYNTQTYYQSLNQATLQVFSSSNKISYLDSLSEYSWRGDVVQNGIYYHYMNNVSSSNIVLQAMLESEEYRFLKIEHGNFYIDNVLQNIYSDSEPETEPIQENLDKVYVPNYQDDQCVEIIDKDTIRVFANENDNIYTDYFINSHYLSRQGQVDLSYEKNCSDLNFTSIGYYRNDFPQILFIIGSLSLFSISFIYILFKRFRKR